jgi:hypothetical protein
MTLNIIPPSITVATVLSVFMLIVDMRSVAFFIVCYAECRYALCQFAECRGAECSHTLLCYLSLNQPTSAACLLNMQVGLNKDNKVWLRDRY